MTTLDDIREYNAYHLADRDRAGCGDPDSRDSAGAMFLTRVRDALVEAVEDGRLIPGDDDDDGTIQEIADSAPSVYTATKWAQFVDLAAYQEDPTELGTDGSDMDNAASVCLYIIAERLCNALLTELAEDDADAEEDE